MPFDPDPTSILRIYKRTIERVKGTYSQLNSNASFLIVADRQNKVVVWHGNRASSDDCSLAEEIGISMGAEMPSGNCGVDVITENKENPSSLQAMLSLLWITEDQYYSNAFVTLRSNSIFNHPKTLYRLRFNSDGSVTLVKVSVNEVNEDGSVNQFVFDNQLFSSTNIIVLNVAKQWDVWIGSQLSRDHIQNGIESVKHFASQANNNSDIRLDGLESVVFVERIRVVKEGYERAIFRYHFQESEKLGMKIPKLEDDDIYMTTAIGQKDCVFGCQNVLFWPFSWLIGFDGINNNEQLQTEDFRDYDPESFVNRSMELRARRDMQEKIQRNQMVLRFLDGADDALIGWQIKVDTIGTGVVVDSNSSLLDGHYVTSYKLKLCNKSKDCWVPLKLAQSFLDDNCVELKINPAEVMKSLEKKGKGHHEFVPIKLFKPEALMLLTSHAVMKTTER